jgi:hypothetical protein
VDLTITLATQLLHQHLQKETDAGSQGVEIQLLQALLQQQLHKQTQNLKQQQQQQNLTVASASTPGLAPQPSFSASVLRGVASAVEPKPELNKQPPFLPLESIIQSQAPPITTPLLQSLQPTASSTPQSPLPPIRPLVALEDLQPDHPLHQHHQSQLRQSQQQQQQSMVGDAQQGVFVTAFPSSTASSTPSSISAASPLLTSLLTSFSAVAESAVPCSSTLSAVPMTDDDDGSAGCAPLNSLVGVPVASTVDIAAAATSLDIPAGLSAAAAVEPLAGVAASSIAGSLASYEVVSGTATPLSVSAVPFEAVPGSLGLSSSMFVSTPATVAVPMQSSIAPDAPVPNMNMTTTTPKAVKPPISTASAAQNIFGQEMPEMTFDEVNEYLQF